MVGTNPTDFFSSRAFSRHSRNAGAVIKIGMGEDGRIVDIARLVMDRRLGEGHSEEQLARNTLSVNIRANTQLPRSI